MQTEADREATILEHVRQIRELTERRIGKRGQARKDLTASIRVHQKALRHLARAESAGERAATFIGKLLGAAVKAR